MSKQMAGEKNCKLDVERTPVTQQQWSANHVYLFHYRVMGN